MKKNRWWIGIVALLVSGCATVASLNDGCVGTYSGIAYNRGVARSDLVSWQESPAQELFLLVDLPFSAVLDTIMLPYTAFASPSHHPAAGPGCKAVSGSE